MSATAPHGASGGRQDFQILVSVRWDIRCLDWLRLESRSFHIRFVEVSDGEGGANDNDNKHQNPTTHLKTSPRASKICETQAVPKLSAGGVTQISISTLRKPRTHH